MQRLVYGTAKPCITQDERTLTERDRSTVSRSLGVIHSRTYYNFRVTRILPDSPDLLARLDRLLLIALRPLSPFLGGRVMACGTLRK
jgi:hypothetical protein